MSNVDNMSMKEIFSRTESLLGGSAMEKLKKARVAVFGVGGVGGYVVEALARCGVGYIELVDSDSVSPSNINRQIIALHSTVGQKKVDAAAARVRDINPCAEVAARDVFFLPETSGEFDFSNYDYVVDCIDTVGGKMEIVKRAKEVGTRVISSMGAGNKLDPTAFEVADIYDTSVCPLAKIMRQLCRKNGIESLKVVYSKEPPMTPAVQMPKDAESGKIPPASAVFAPAAAGLAIAYAVVCDLAL